MNTVAACGLGQRNVFTVTRLRIVTLILFCGLAPSAFAFDEETTSSVVAQVWNDSRRAHQAAARDFCLFPAPLRQHRRIQPHLAHRHDMAAAAPFGPWPFAGHDERRRCRPFPPVRPATARRPPVDLGLHWRYTLDSNYRIDVTAWRRLVPPDALTLVQMQRAQLWRTGRDADRLRPEERVRGRPRFHRPAAGKRRAGDAAPQRRQADDLLPHQVLTPAPRQAVAARPAPRLVPVAKQAVSR